jgi:hypothetical protein
MDSKMATYWDYLSAEKMANRKDLMMGEPMAEKWDPGKAERMVMRSGEVMV